MAARRKAPRARTKAAREFVSEVEEILERLRSDLADLADERARGALDPERTNRLFRSAHTLKGLSGMFGLDEVTQLAHHLEDILDGLRLGRLGPDAPALDLLDESVEWIASLLTQLGEAGALDAPPQGLQQLIDRIREKLEASPRPATSTSLAGLEESVLRALTEYEEHRLHENLRLGRCLLLVEQSFPMLAFEEGLAELTRAVRDAGEVISTLPAPGGSPEAEIRFSLLAASELDDPAARVRLEVPQAEVRVLREAAGGTPAAGASSAERSATPPPPSPAAPAELESLKSISDTVRVDIRKLDEVMNLVGELVIQRGALGALATRLRADPATARAGAELAGLHKHIDRKLQDLQAGVLEARMVPMRQVFEKLSRVVRRLRRDSGKEVKLEIRGGDTELDKLLVEELVDPLMHVVRNAFDHAIETPDERSAAGKPREGCIRLEAFQRGHHVVVRVSDDGRGIDTDAILARAIADGSVGTDAHLSRKEVLDLVFQPGLSTSAEVSATSGRGVGMDIVRENAAALGGSVGIESEPGAGTSISLTLPITLAIIQALAVRVGSQRFAVPLTSVLETLQISPAEIQHSQGRELLRLRGEPLWLRRVHAEFELPPPAPDANLAVVVVALGDARVGLLVDQLEEQQDAVIKPIQGPIGSVRGIAGATDLGARGTVLVMDVAALAEDTLRRREVA